jgi:hypothetical protein
MTDDTGGRKAAEVVYDLLLPDDINSVLIVHSAAQSPVQRLGNRHVKLASLRLGSEFLEGPAEIGEGQRGLGVGFGTLRSVECVVLHHTLDAPPVTALRRGVYRRRLIRSCKAVLAPAGLLAISCSNPWSADRVRGWLSGRLPEQASPITRGISPWGCHQLLRCAEFELLETFAVVLKVATPAAIVSARREAAQVFYARAMGPVSSNMLRATMLPARWLNALNIRPYLESAFLVLARHD